MDPDSEEEVFELLKIEVHCGQHKAGISVNDGFATVFRANSPAKIANVQNR
jgi:hypothetical protein